jgi:hypothetical protein
MVPKMSEHISGAALAAALPSPDLVVAEIRLATINGWGIDAEGAVAAIRGADSQGLPVAISFPFQYLDAAIAALAEARRAAEARQEALDGGSEQQRLTVTELRNFQCSPALANFDGVIATFNAGAEDAISFGLPLTGLPAVITQLHAAGQAQHKSRKRLIVPQGS